MKAKFIYEKFELESDPIQDMGIGIRHKIEEWLNQHYIIDYVLTPELKINVNQSVNLNGKIEGKSLPSYIKFNNIEGNFEISNNANLISLRGCPRFVTEFFFFVNCPKLKSLKYCPKDVKAFVCWSQERVRKKEVIFKYNRILKLCKAQFVYDDIGCYDVTKRKYTQHWNRA